jgi:2-polyprenyl-6-methoxyphenol hydroxylase-like FAD-dependent oxidoreductase
MNKLITDKNIAIVGGGPGGLTLARILQMNGADVTVYERDANSEARAKGATLDLHEESGLRALREAGLMDEFRANYRPGADKLRIVDKHAHIIFDDDEHGRGDASRPEIDRGPLQKILFGSLKPGTVVWDSKFMALSQQNGACKLDFENGTSGFADIVIAADGANSKLRPYITPIKPFYSGVTAVEGAVYNSAGVIPAMHRFLNGGKIFAMGDTRSLIVSSKGDGSLVFYTSFNCDEDWVKTYGIDFADKVSVLAWFKKEYADWDTIWLELFEHACGSFIPRPQYCMPFDQTWETLPNLTLLGDAAHLMPPFAGEGVNMAMLDALELGLCLISDDFDDVQSAIAAYETGMRARAGATAEQTMEATVALHAEGAIEYMMGVIS